MSSLFKKIGVSSLALCLLLFPGGCGFQPMYGDNAMQATHTPLQGNLTIAPMKGRNGQILKIALEDMFNPEGIKFAKPDYTLQIILRQNLIPTVIRSDGSIQRYDVRFDSDFKLFRVGTPSPIFSGALRRTGSYNVANNANFATYEAEQDIIDRTLKEMAEDYVLRISGYFANPDAKTP